MDPRLEVTQLLVACSEGDDEAHEELLTILYDQLKRLAHVRLRRERPGHTLNTTGLVHEAYLRLVDINQIRWQNRQHYLAVASRVMRRILLNYARDRNAVKRGGAVPHVPVEEDRLMPDSYAEVLLDLNDALNRMEQLHPRQAEVVQHRYFAGFTSAETAEALGVSVTTVERDLRFARAWLSREWKTTLADLN